MSDWQRRLKEICADRKSGATELAKRAVRLLKSMERQKAPFENLVTAAEQIAAAHPAMAPLWHIAQLVREQKLDQSQQLSKRLRQFLEDMERHAQQAVNVAVEWLPEGVVPVHSFSSLVFRALTAAHKRGKRVKVVCTVALPGGEGVALAKALKRNGVPVTLVADLHAFAWLPRCDLFLVGADAWCLDGLVHKVGTHPLAWFARHLGVPVWSLGTTEKRLPLRWRETMKGQAPPLAPSSIAQDRTLYDLTEWSLVAGIISEEGVCPAEKFALSLQGHQNSLKMAQ